MGRIGTTVARMAAGLGMQVIAYDPLSKDLALRPGLGIGGHRSSELLDEADVVSLHLPLTEETTHLIDAAAHRAHETRIPS